MRWPPQGLTQWESVDSGRDKLISQPSWESRPGARWNQSSTRSGRTAMAMLAALLFRGGNCAPFLSNPSAAAETTLSRTANASILYIAGPVSQSRHRLWLKLSGAAPPSPSRLADASIQCLADPLGVLPVFLAPQFTGLARAFLLDGQHGHTDCFLAAASRGSCSPSGRNKRKTLSPSACIMGSRTSWAAPGHSGSRGGLTSHHPRDTLEMEGCPEAVGQVLQRGAWVQRVTRKHCRATKKHAQGSLCSQPTAQTRRSTATENSSKFRLASAALREAADRSSFLKEAENAACQNCDQNACTNQCYQNFIGKLQDLEETALVSSTDWLRCTEP